MVYFIMNRHPLTLQRPSPTIHDILSLLIVLLLGGLGLNLQSPLSFPLADVQAILSSVETCKSFHSVQPASSLPPVHPPATGYDASNYPLFYPT